MNTRQCPSQLILIVSQSIKVVLLFLFGCCCFGCYHVVFVVVVDVVILVAVAIVFLVWFLVLVVVWLLLAWLRLKLNTKIFLNYTPPHHQVLLDHFQQNSFLPQPIPRVSTENFKV